jgi:hypothetical protein
MSQTPSQELEKKKSTNSRRSSDGGIRRYKSQLLANKITVQQNKKLNELKKKVERLTITSILKKRARRNPTNIKQGTHGLATRVV